MDGKAMRAQIVSAEWEMFQTTHNKGGRANCQEDWITFCNMRGAQFAAWSDEAAESYLSDLRTAMVQGRNLVAEKYLNMMKNTHPEEYEAQKHFLPALNETKLALAQEICDEMIAQAVPLRECYPHVGNTGRPLFSSEDKYGTSVQTYQLGELLTYSVRTLQLLKNISLPSRQRAGAWLGKSLPSASAPMALTHLRKRRLSYLQDSLKPPERP